MKKLWLPALTACMFLAISVSAISYGWYLKKSLPFPRDGFAIIQILSFWLVGVVLFIGSTGYLAAVPGLEMGERGFRAKATRYGRFVGDVTKNVRTTCGVGYSFGAMIYGSLVAISVVCGLLTALYFLASEVAAMGVPDSAELRVWGKTISATVFIAAGLIVLWRAWRGLRASTFFAIVCPPRETREL